MTILSDQAFLLLGMAETCQKDSKQGSPALSEPLLHHTARTAWLHHKVVAQRELQCARQNSIWQPFTRQFLGCVKTRH